MILATKNYPKKSLYSRHTPGKNQDQDKNQDPVVPQTAKCTAEKEVHIYEEFNKISKELGAKFILSWANRDESYLWLGNWARTQQITFADWQPTLESVRQNMPVPEANPHSGGYYRVLGKRHYCR